MQRLELAGHSGHATASRSRPRGAPSTPHGVYAELLDQLLGPIQRRRREAQRILDGLSQRRAAMSRLDRSAASHSLGAQAVQIRNELARLSLVESLIRRILQPLASRDTASSPAPDPPGRELA